MSTPPNALFGPVWVDAEGNGYTSPDGGKTFSAQALGGTVHTSSPLTGDGSIGDPITITTPTAGFGLMAARAAAWGAALTTPYVFNSAYQEDFALGLLTVTDAKGGAGVDPTFSTSAANLGGAGIMKMTAGGVTDNDFVYASAINTNAWIADLKTTTFYLSTYSKLTGVLAQANSFSGIGVFNAAALSGSSKFVIAGIIQGASTTKWGTTIYNGTTQSFHAGNVAFDQSAFHYLDLAHDAVANVYYFYVDGVLVDSISDAAMTSSTAGTAWGAVCQSVLLGVQIDKAYCAV